MIIGIDASRAFIKNRTGIEEYSYQVIKNLTDKLNGHQVILYIRQSQTSNVKRQTWPENWKIKVIKFPRFWTQLGLSLEMLLHPVDALFVPAHTVPFIHPKKTVVTIHGLEYEFCPKAYSFWGRIYMRASIKNSCHWASRIISVSENTKKDLMRLYVVDEKKVSVIYEGYEIVTSNQSLVTSAQDASAPSYQLPVTSYKPYLLFIGRIEERKNVINIINAFEILKEKYNIPHKLVLAGKPGYGYENVKRQALNVKCKEDIVELGFVSEGEKWELLKNADVFVFPTLYEGFGIPILEAQSVGCAVVASNNSSIPEIVGAGDDCSVETHCNASLLVNPLDPQDIAENIHKLISDEKLKNGIIERGLENVKRFSWSKCANQIAELLNG